MVAKLEDWRNFYQEELKINITKDQFKKIEPFSYSDRLIVLPQSVNLQNCFESLNRQLGQFITNINNQNEVLLKTRNISDSYITNSCDYLIEIIIIDLFDLYFKENILHRTWRKDNFNDNVSIEVESSDSFDYVMHDYQGIKSPWEKHIRESRLQNTTYSVLLI